MDEKGRHLDLSSEVPTDRQQGEGRPFLGVHFTCCDAYSRVYPNRDSTAYVGYCPRCAKRLSIPIGPGGTDSRFFTAS